MISRFDLKSFETRAEYGPMVIGRVCCGELIGCLLYTSDLPFGSTDSIYWESAECGGRKKQALSAAFGNQYYQCYAWDAGYAYICIENRSGNNHPWAAPAAYYIQ